MASNWIVTLCAADCQGYGGAQICREASDRANDGPCNWFSCPADTAVVTIGLCTATAPNGCE